MGKPVVTLNGKPLTDIVDIQYSIAYVNVPTITTVISPTKELDYVAPEVLDLKPKVVPD